MLLSRAEQEAEIIKWTPYAHSLAFAFWDRRGRRWGTLEDFQVVAVEGLWEAARRFQPARGCQFSTYATAWVKQAMWRFRDKSIGVPSHWTRSNATDVDKELLRRAGQKRSIDATCGPNGDMRIKDCIAGRDEDEKPEFPPDFWERVNKWLDPRYQQVIRMRFIDGLTLEEVAEAMGLTRERVRQLEAKSLDIIHRRVDFGECLDQFEFRHERRLIP